MGNFQQIWSYNLNNASITLDGNWGLNTVSILVTSGTVNITGSGKAGPNASGKIAVTTTTGGGAVVLGGSGAPLDGVIIDATGGGVAILFGYN